MDTDKVLEKIVEHVKALPPIEQAQIQLADADRRMREIMEMMLAVRGEAEQVIKGLGSLPLDKVDETTGRFMLLVQKRDILTDMHRLAKLDIERKQQGINALRAQEVRKGDEKNAEKRRKLNLLRYSLADVDIKYDKARVEKTMKEIAQLEGELGGAARTFVPS